jgi:TRAP-type C4-dicarboxylate transport system permease small subunit
MTDHAQQHHSVRPARTILSTIGIIICSALLLLWSWNTLATDLFHMPAIELRHALALELCLLATYLSLRAASTLLSFSHRHYMRRSIP